MTAVSVSPHLVIVDLLLHVGDVLSSLLENLRPAGLVAPQRGYTVL